MNTPTDPTMSGEHFMMGNHAAAEGALAAGCRFYAGYPITPSSEIAERMSNRMPRIGGQYLQMEDEIASIAAVLGASCAGAKPMTATSGPGLSLMLENIGLGRMMELPAVIVNVQRGGPSTGLPTLTAQADMMQAQWGSHGDAATVAYAPGTVQEMFDLTVKAFNTAERLRTPVFVMADQIIGQMTGTVRIPAGDKIERVDRPRASGTKEEYQPYDPAHLVPPMALAGDGYGIHMTGLTHDARGYPNTTAAGQEATIPRLLDKVLTQVDTLHEVEEVAMEDAEIALVIYGSSRGPALEAVEAARKEGIKVGMWRMKTPWPFPYRAVEELSNRVDKILVAEANMGQMVRPVREVAECPVHFHGHPGGRIFHPMELLDKIREVSQ